MLGVLESPFRHRSRWCLAVVAVAALALVELGHPRVADAAALKVMSFNIRYDNGFSTLTDPNGWLYGCGPRRDRVVYTIEEQAPDVFGVQEALVNQMSDLDWKLPGYDWYGVGRNDGVSAGEFSAVFYRADRFTRIGQGTFWLSNTPDVPGTTFPCSGSIRLASWVKLHDLHTGLDYFVLDTHWDNVCQDSREKSAVLVRQKIAELSGGLPVIAMGDLNAGESSLAVSTLRGVNDPGGLQLADSYREVFPTVAPDEATFHGFGGSTAGSRIDFVLAEDIFAPAGASIVHTGFSCGWPSDHFPVTATFDVAGVAGAEESGAAPDAALALTDPCIPNCTGCGASVAPHTPAKTPVAALAGGALVLVALARGLRRRISRRGLVSAVALVATAWMAGCHTVDSIEPPQGCPGNVVRIGGTGFGLTQEASRVFFGDVEATQIGYWSNDYLDVIVPDGTVTAPVRVEVLGEMQQSDDSFAVVAGLACRGSLIAGPSEYGYDADLESLARKYDRQFHALHALPMAVNADLTVATSRIADRELIRSFLQESDGWDFEAYAGKSPYDTVSGWNKVAGLYGGVGIAADAYRYGVLRDQGYPADEVLRARQHLLAALDALHLAVDITGVDGVIARGFHRRDIPGDGVTQPTTPLFDENGNPLPPEKDNGTWREDNSGGTYSNYIWEDSCSRDMLVGWTAAFGATWEVIAADPTFGDEVRTRMQADAAALGRMLSTVNASGYDLEIQDADGRPTFHAYLNENAFDRLYLPFLPFKDGFYSAMSLGIVSALVYTSGDPVLTSYLYDDLIGTRRLSDIAAANLVGVDVGYQTNFSAVNMVDQGILEAQRYITDPRARENLITSLKWKLYAKQPATRQPIEQEQSLYDFTYAAGITDTAAFQTMQTRPDAGALARGITTLKNFPTPPYWDAERINCDESEIAAGVCTAVDGTHLDLLGFLGRGDTLIAVQPIPMRIRPPSNYHWRSNPYEPNGGGDGSRLLPGVDFRYAYWYGRWVR